MPPPQWQGAVHAGNLTQRPPTTPSPAKRSGWNSSASLNTPGRRWLKVGDAATMWPLGTVYSTPAEVVTLNASLA